MSRQEILSSPEYWIAKTQIDLYNCAEDFMEANDFNRSQLAKHLGVSKGYITQLLNGDYDHKLSKLVELAISFGYVPHIEFRPIEEVISEDKIDFKVPDGSSTFKYIPGISSKATLVSTREDYEVAFPDFKNSAA